MNADVSRCEDTSTVWIDGKHRRRSIPPPMVCHTPSHVHMKRAYRRDVDVNPFDSAQDIDGVLLPMVCLSRRWCVLTPSDVHKNRIHRRDVDVKTHRRHIDDGRHVI